MKIKLKRKSWETEVCQLNDYGRNDNWVLGFGVHSTELIL